MRSSVNVKLLGNWPGATKAYALMVPAIRRSVVNGQRRYARRLVAKVKGHIMSQDLPWPPASESKRGQILMIDTREYYSSIRYWQKNYELYVGVPKHFIHGRTGQPLWKVATWQEKGTKNIPARALWGPSIDELGGVTQVSQEVTQEMFKTMAILGTGIFKTTKE